MQIRNQTRTDTNPLLLKFLREAGEDPSILAIYHYGSSVTDESFRDIDLCIISSLVEKSAFFQRFLYYSGRYGASGEKPLDISLFSLLPLYIKVRVIGEGKILLMNDRDMLFNLVINYRTYN